MLTAKIHISLAEIYILKPIVIRKGYELQIEALKMVSLRFTWFSLEVFTLKVSREFMLFVVNF